LREARRQRSSKDRFSASNILNDRELNDRETAFHRVQFQETSGFPFGFNFAPESNRHNYGFRFAVLVGNVLNIKASH
jgi:hypothetical protein